MARPDSEAATRVPTINKGKRRRLVLWNAAVLAGVLASAFTLPPSTPVWEWALISTAVLAIMNCALLLRTSPADRLDSPKRRSGLKAASVAVALLILALATDDLMHWQDHRGRPLHDGVELALAAAVLTALILALVGNRR